MHVLQWLIVEADDEESAASLTDTLLESEMGDGENPRSWYDWYVIGGGRWNTEPEEGLMGGYQTKTNMIISYDKDPNAFRARIDKGVQARIEEYNEYLAEAKEHNVIDKLDNYGGAMSYDHALYPLSRLIAFQQGTWDYDSKFYDLIHWSANATHILSKLDNHDQTTPETVTGIFLVPVDFHF